MYLPELVASGDALDAAGADPWIRRLAGFQLPNVTFVGGGSRAYFNALVRDLPDPIVYDEESAKLRRRVAEIRKLSEARDADEGSS